MRFQVKYNKTTCIGLSFILMVSLLLWGWPQGVSVSKAQTDSDQGPRIYDFSDIEVEDSGIALNSVTTFYGSSDPYTANQKDWDFLVRGSGVGQHIAFDFEVDQSSEYNLALKYHKAAFGSIISISVDGETIIDELDTYSAAAAYDEIANLGNLELGEGTHTISLELVGRTHSSARYYMYLHELLVTKISAPATTYDFSDIEVEDSGIALNSVTTFYGSSDPYTANQKDWDFLVRGSGVGQHIAFDFEVLESKEYNLALKHHMAAFGSIISISVDGQILVDELDTYSAAAVYDEVANLGIVNLEKGTHTLKLELVGRTHSSARYYMYLHELIIKDPSAQNELYSVEANADTTTLEVGASTSLEVTGVLSDATQANLSNADIEYSSSNPDIVSIDANGVITAHAKGIVSLTVDVTLDKVTRSDDFTLTVVEPVIMINDGHYGAESNPTGNPIGGGEGYSNVMTDTTIVVDKAEALIEALNNAQSGDVVYVADEADLDFAGYSLPLTVKEGITLASGRGTVDSEGNVSPGARLKIDQPGATLIEVTGPNARITGLRIYGFDEEVGTTPYSPAITYGIVALQHPTEIDNNEIYGWSSAGIRISDGHVHHNYIHHTVRKGLGYGVWVDDVKTPDGVLVEANLFEWNRHAIASDGASTERYEARYNVVLHNQTLHAFDMHGTYGGSGGTAGDVVNIHHNTFKFMVSPTTGNERMGVYIRGRSVTGTYVYNNRFDYHNEDFVIKQIPNEGNMFVGSNQFGTDEDISIYEGVYHLNNPLSLKTDQREMHVGEEIQLQVTSNKTSDLSQVEYASEDEAIATVDENGVVSAQAVGSVFISAVISIDSETYESKMKLTVNREEVDQVYFESITLEPQKDTIYEGETTKLRLTGQMSDTSKADLSNAIVEYSSSNPFVATVSEDGTVSAKEMGTSIIKAKVTLNGVTQSETIVFTTASEFVSLTINPAQETLYEGQTLQYRLKPLTANGRAPNLRDAAINFKVNKDHVAWINADGLVTAVSNGEAMILAEVRLHGKTQKDKAYLTVIGNDDDGLIVDDNFEDTPVGELPIGWEDPNAGNGDIVYVSQDSKSGNKYLELTRESNVVSAYRSINSQTGKLTLEYDIMVYQQDAFVGGGYFLDSAGSTISRLWFDHVDGHIKIRNGTSGSVQVAPYEPNTWYSMKKVLDIPNQTYDIYIDGELKVENAAFNKSDVLDVSKVWFFIGSTSVGSAHIDNVKIYDPDNYNDKMGK